MRQPVLANCVRDAAAILTLNTKSGEREKTTRKRRPNRIEKSVVPPARFDDHGVLR
jgi:hypothetical protein